MHYPLNSNWGISSSGAVSVTVRPVAQQVEMTPFVEVPLDPQWPAIVRQIVASQPDDFFRPFLGGRLPNAEEKKVCIDLAVRNLTPQRIFVNSLYRVQIQRTVECEAEFVHLSIARLDGGSCKEWRHLQQIKNEVVGPEYEAIELFPAESRLVDTGNEYHLWVCKNREFRFPVGWSVRAVRDTPISISAASLGR